jgi:hypothetical protein
MRLRAPLYDNFGHIFLLGLSSFGERSDVYSIVFTFRAPRISVAPEIDPPATVMEINVSQIASIRSGYDRILVFLKCDAEQASIAGPSGTADRGCLQSQEKRSRSESNTLDAPRFGRGFDDFKSHASHWRKTCGAWALE